MKNFLFAAVFMLLIVVAVSEGQERQLDCSNAYEMALEVDAIYNEFLMARSEVDMQANLSAVEDMQASLDELLSACESAGNTAEDADEPVLVDHLGSGTDSDPYGYNQAAPADSTMDLRVVELRRPADEWLASETASAFDAAQEGQEYVAVSVEVLCSLHSDSTCEVDHTTFRLTGDSGIEYVPADVRFANEMNLFVHPSRSAVGVIPFLIDAEDTNLTLIYSSDAFTGNDEWVYYRAQAAIEVVAMSELIVRGGPGTQYVAQGGLVEGQIANAIGRNEDATWLRIPDGWVYSNYLYLREGDVFLLPVVEE